MKHIKEFWKNIFNTEGRISRKDYLITWILVQVMQILLVLTIIGIFAIPIVIIGIVTMTIRRLNDINKSKWYLILLFIPFLVNIIFFIYLCCAKSVNENNVVVTTNENFINEVKNNNDEKQNQGLDELTSSSVGEKKKILKISFIKFIFIALIIGFILVIGITFFINSTTLVTPTIDNSWFFDYQGHWECVGGEENRYLEDVRGAWIYRYDLLLYDYNGFGLVKQSSFYKQYNNGNYDTTALSSKDEVARGVIINEGENVYLYFTEIDFETLDLSAHGFKDVTAINDYGFRPGDRTRVLVTSDNYNIMTVYTPDGEMIFKK